MLPTYDPAAWFWRADDARVYSSAAHAVVPESDAAFKAWQADGGIPTVWPRNEAGEQTQDALDAVLIAAGVKASPAPVITYKADLYRRMTDAEADQIEQALAAAPVRQRRLFEAAQYLDHADAEFAAMHSALVGLFGEERADALLAAS